MNLFCLLWVPWQSSWRFLGNPIIPKIESETIDWECLSFSWHTRRCLFYLLASDAETNPPYIQVLWWLVDCWRVGATQILFTEPQQQGPEKDSWCYVQASVCQLALLFFLTVQLILQLSNSNSLEGGKRQSELFQFTFLYALAPADFRNALLRSQGGTGGEGWVLSLC